MKLFSGLRSFPVFSHRRVQCACVQVTWIGIITTRLKSSATSRRPYSPTTAVGQ